MGELTGDIWDAFMNRKHTLMNNESNTRQMSSVYSHCRCIDIFFMMLELHLPPASMKPKHYDSEKFHKMIL